MPESPPDLVVLMPVYNDWTSAGLLLRKIDEAVKPHPGWKTRIVVVDDGSTEDAAPLSPAAPLQAVGSVEILRLRRNLGHQRAIAVGLTWVQQERPCDAVVVMDADGEDRPEGIPALVDRWKSEAGKPVVFAGRARRLENFVFRALYRVYQLLHFLLVGAGVRVGNFSLVPYAQLSRLVVVSELWNHYAAAVFKARLPRAVVPLDRGRRLAGRSSMNFVALVTHGLSAISVFSETVAVRLLVASGILGAVFLGLLGAVVGVRLATDLAIPGWATFAGGLLLLLLAQVLTVSFTAVLFLLTSRNSLSFLPLRDFRMFVSSVEKMA